MDRRQGSIVAPARVRWIRQGAPAPGARYVLYWIQINQRARMNAALDFAVEEADRLDLPLLAYQGLRPDYPGANDRLHTFILEGAFDVAEGLSSKGIRHLFHLERRKSAASGLLAALAREAAVVVTDHFPVFIVNAQTRALARQIERPLAAVDASCIVPLALFPRAEFAARTLRPRIHRVLPEHLIPREEIAPRRSSLGLEVPFPFPGTGLEAEERDWLDLRTGPPETDGRRGRISEWVASCAIDHGIAPSPIFRGGEREAHRRLALFVEEKLGSYPEARSDPSVDGTSGLSAYLHFGQIASLEVALEVLAASGARARGGAGTAGESGRHRSTADARRSAGGARNAAKTHRPRDGTGEGPLAPEKTPLPPGETLLAPDKTLLAPGHALLAPEEIREALVSALAERDGPAGAFLEQLVVRRELAFNFCERTPEHGSIDALPSWARRTLFDHEDDERRPTYEAGTLEWSETGDEVWNAAQKELRLTGVIHNRMRMLWGKKILEWSPSPAEALSRMIDLHERYALDGRDPNTYANVLWCLGLHDRPFGPGRPVLGTVRSMSSEILRRRFDFESYAARLKRLEESS